MAWISCGTFLAPLVVLLLAFSSVAHTAAMEATEFGNCPFPTPTPPEIIDELTFIGSGQRLSGRLNFFRTIEWDARSGRVVIPKHGLDGTTAWSADERLFAVLASGDEGEICLCGTGNAKVIRKFKCPRFLVSLLFTPDQRHLLAADLRGHISVWNLTSGETVAEFNVAPKEGRLWRLCMSPRGVIGAHGDDYSVCSAMRFVQSE